jgi:hypothetical protein
MHKLRSLDRLTGRTARWKLAALFAVVVMALAGSAIAYSLGGPNQQLVGQDRVYGGGTYQPANIRNFAIDAHASGAAAYGNIEYAAGVTIREEQITCLTVSGSKATLGGIIQQATDPSLVGWAFMWVVQDSGSPLSGTPDTATFQSLGPTDAPDWPARFPQVCPSPGDAISIFALDSFPLSGGDIVVQDAR